MAGNALKKAYQVPVSPVRFDEKKCGIRPIFCVFVANAHLETRLGGGESWIRTLGPVFNG